MLSSTCCPAAADTQRVRRNADMIVFGGMGDTPFDCDSDTLQTGLPRPPAAPQAPASQSPVTPPEGDYALHGEAGYRASFTQRNPTVAFLSNPGEIIRSIWCLSTGDGPPCTYQMLDVGL